MQIGNNMIMNLSSNILNGNRSKLLLNDYRYNILSNMKKIIFCTDDNLSYIYLRINSIKDYYITSDNQSIQVNIIEYTNDGKHSEFIEENEIII